MTLQQTSEIRQTRNKLLILLQSCRERLVLGQAYALALNEGEVAGAIERQANEITAQMDALYRPVKPLTGYAELGGK